MKHTAVISAGYIGGVIEDHEGYEDRLYKSKPIEAPDFHITYHNYGDFMFNFHAGKKVIGIDAAVGANVTDAMLEWLEAICNGYWECLFLIDEEGPLTMLCCSNINWDNPNVRISILTTNERYWNKGFAPNEATYEKAHEKDQCVSQVVFDVYVDKNKFIKDFYQALTDALKTFSDEDFEQVNARKPKRTSKIVKQYLLKHASKSRRKKVRSK